jgi:hypothetical protein
MRDLAIERYWRDRDNRTVRDHANFLAWRKAERGQPFPI